MLDQVRKRFAEHRGQASKFALVGVLNTVVDIAVYIGLIAISVHPVIANIAAFFVANLQSYFVNARFTFARNGAPAATSFSGYGKYVLSHSVSLAVSTAIIALLASTIGPIPAKLLALVVTFGMNYFASTLLVFGNRDEASGSSKPGEDKKS